jgi:hypothetical protein
LRGLRNREKIRVMDHGGKTLLMPLTIVIEPYGQEE